MTKDKIFHKTSAESGSFEFNESVARVFPNMLRRSIPGYEASLEAIGMLVKRHAKPNTRCYDLGCSLGESTLAIRHNINVLGCEILAIDSAPAMVKACRAIMEADKHETPVSVREADIRNIKIANASIVVMNYTLQFLPIADRQELISNIHQGMVSGGMFVLSEKISNENAVVNSLLSDLHHQFKRAQAYSDLEIDRKRTALENILIPETEKTHIERLSKAGFQHPSIWLKYLNFISIVTIR